MLMTSSIGKASRTCPSRPAIVSAAKRALTMAEGVGGGEDAQGADEQDGGLQDAEFPQLDEAKTLAVPVEDEGRRECR
jgi:hypothetical protein